MSSRDGQQLGDRCERRSRNFEGWRRTKNENQDWFDDQSVDSDFLNERVRKRKKKTQWDQNTGSSHSVGSMTKRLREVYVGNIPSSAHTASALTELFENLMATVPNAKKPAVTSVQIGTAGGSQLYAFIEFVDESLASTALLFHGFTVGERCLRIGRPAGYSESPYGPVPALDIPAQVLEELGVSGVASKFTAKAGVVGLALKKQRELYVGNLAAGQVTAFMLRDFLSRHIREVLRANTNDALTTPVVLNVELQGGGKFAFVEFHDEDMATLALHIFNKCEFCGKQLRVGRPAGYVDNSNLNIALSTLKATSLN
uniref:RRM domain-containing protein n=1 Tax=Aureoumbra lagunensis TaxID=44058 RepID=A0A7S3JXX3_9STRA